MGLNDGVFKRQREEIKGRDGGRHLGGGEFGTQTSGKQFEIGEIRSCERRVGPPGDKFQMASRKDSMGRRPETWADALGSAQRGAVGKE